VARDLPYPPEPAILARRTGRSSSSTNGAPRTDRCSGGGWRWFPVSATRTARFAAASGPGASISTSAERCPHRRHPGATSMSRPRT